MLRLVPPPQQLSSFLLSKGSRARAQQAKQNAAEQVCISMGTDTRILAKLVRFEHRWHAEAIVY